MTWQGVDRPELRHVCCRVHHCYIFTASLESYYIFPIPIPIPTFHILTRSIFIWVPDSASSCSVFPGMSPHSPPTLHRILWPIRSTRSVCRDGTMRSTTSPPLPSSTTCSPSPATKTSASPTTTHSIRLALLLLLLRNPYHIDLHWDSLCHLCLHHKKEDQAELRHTLMRTASGQAFLCALPPIPSLASSKQSPQAQTAVPDLPSPETEDLERKSERQKIEQEGLENGLKLISSLKDRCIYTRLGWFTYSFC
jgi:hypothetical protein